MQENTIIKIPRTEDTFTQEIPCGKFTVRYAYARSAESRLEDEPGQDYLTFNQSNKSFCFVVCDGVSQSFFGDLAAQVLGDGLIQWLIAQNSNIGKKQLTPSLHSHLVALTGPGSQIVESHQIDKDIPAMLESVLEEKRTLGSESMFFCGRIDLPGKEFPRGRVLFSWMGDGRIRTWNRKKELTKNLGLEQETGKRWSTKKGLVGGDPGFFLGALASPTRKYLYQHILAYTDGFVLLDKEKPPVSNKKYDQLIEQSLALPENDDLTMIEVSISK